MTKIGMLGHNGRVFLNWLDTDTGERGRGWFRLDVLCRLGYGNRHIDEDLVISVQSRRLAVVR